MSEEGAEKEPRSLLSQLGTTQQAYRKRLEQITQNLGRNIEQLPEGLAKLNSGNLGEELSITDKGGLGVALWEIWERTRKTIDEVEYSFVGLRSTSDEFAWTDIDRGKDNSAPHNIFSSHGQVLVASPPNYFDLLENPQVTPDEDTSQTYTAEAHVHSHPPSGPNFFSHAELPGFERSEFAKRGGMIGLLTTYGTYMVTKAKNNGLNIYALQADGTFRLSLVSTSKDLLNEYSDYYLTNHQRSQLLHQIQDLG